MPERLDKNQKAQRAKLIEQSYRIADALESQGVKAYGESKLTLVGVCSGKTVDLPDFRNIVFIPSVAQRKRHKMLRHLEYFIQEHPFSRMWVLTSGTRTPMEDTRERVSQLHRRISKLNAQPFMKDAGAQIVFRSTELGKMERDEQKRPTFHVHAHVIVHLHQRLPLERWKALLKAVSAWWKHKVLESRRIEGVRETCKYVVKPGDLENLTAPELAELHFQLLKLHLVQPLGILKEQRKAIDEGEKKLVKRQEGDKYRWRVVPNWNESRGGKTDEATPPPPYDAPPEDWILSTLAPSFALSNMAEPLAVVLNYTGERLLDNRRIKRLREFCGPIFEP